MVDRTPEGSRTLAHIAGLLGLSVEQFTDPSMRSRWDSRAEGLQLLNRIESQEGMRRALETLRIIADAEPRRDGRKDPP